MPKLPKSVVEGAEPRGLRLPHLGRCPPRRGDPKSCRGAGNAKSSNTAPAAGCAGSTSPRPPPCPANKPEPAWWRLLSRSRVANAAARGDAYREAVTVTVTVKRRSERFDQEHISIPGQSLHRNGLPSPPGQNDTPCPRPAPSDRSHL